MLKGSIMPILCIGATILFSCVSSKKYKSATSEIDRLNAQNNSLQQQVNDLSASNKSMSAEFSSYKTECETVKNKYEIYHAVVKEIKSRMNEVEKMIETGVADFANEGVDVYEKDNRVFVNMEDKLLYMSGSSKLSENGKKALAGLASALNQYPNLQVIVVGHTDDVPFKKGANLDNLSLSTERANGVVRALRDDYGVNPDRLVAAGQGIYGPIADNATAEGKAKNRRTEIILNPDLNKLWDSVEP